MTTELKRSIYWRYFSNAHDEAMHYQHAAYLVSANARQIKRFGPLRCAQMQREASALYAAARDAMEKHHAP